MEKYLPLRGLQGLPESSTFLADLEKSTQTFFSQQRASLSLSSQYEMEGVIKNNVVLKSLQAQPGHSRHGPGMSQVATLGMGPETMLIYDEFLQQHRKPVSKLDVEEKRKREAREKGIQLITASPLNSNVRASILTSLFATGYYYELDDSYDESDEEEVRAHLRRVAEQPPLKLDDSTEVKYRPTHIVVLFLEWRNRQNIALFSSSAQKVDFLGVLGLTTMSQRDEVVQRKRRKRRRMLRECSPSPPASHSKRTPPPPQPQLSTRFTPEELDRAPELEDKKRFLTTFRLSHVTAQQRKGQRCTDQACCIEKYYIIH